MRKVLPSPPTEKDAETTKRASRDSSLRYLELAILQWLNENNAETKST
jgi:hypothetical protein